MSTTSQAVLSPESDSESGYACDKSAEAFRTIGEVAKALGITLKSRNQSGALPSNGASAFKSKEIA